jgi:uncharacterized protein
MRRDPSAYHAGVHTGQPTGAVPPPPGWYPDPQGAAQQRYWDGTNWTDQVHPPSPPPPPSGSFAVPSAVDADRSARQWALFTHLSALAALVVGLPFLGPLVIYLVKKDDHPFIADQAREALNFNISVFIYEVAGAIAAFVLFFVLIGILLIPLLIAVAIAWLVLVIVAAVAANRGEAYRYPLTIRLVS